MLNQLLDEVRTQTLRKNADPTQEMRSVPVSTIVYMVHVENEPTRCVSKELRQAASDIFAKNAALNIHPSC